MDAILSWRCVPLNHARDVWGCYPQGLQLSYVALVVAPTLISRVIFVDASRCGGVNVLVVDFEFAEEFIAGVDVFIVG